MSKYKLSDDALEVVDELFRWLIWGQTHEDSLIAMYREEIQTTFGD
ncbi:MAG: hypothetical protein OXC18_20875 [Desulfurellaceae bacterium]|nr:hypothetical protein [Desulfurellaceae bacterium]